MPHDRPSDLASRSITPRLLLALGSISLIAACSGGSDDAGNTTVAASSSVGPAASAASTIADAEPVTTSTAAPTPSSTTTSTTSTTSTTTSTTTTTTEPPPPPEWTVSQARLQSEASDGLRSWVAAGASATGDQQPIVVGATAAGPGQPDAATVCMLAGGEWVARQLDHGDAAQSFANDVARRGDRVVVAGVTLDDRHVGATAIWVSNDGGQTFGAANVVGGEYSRGVAVALTDTRLFVVEQINDGSGRFARVRSGPANDSTLARLPVRDGWDWPDVEGMIASDDVVVIAGQIDNGERNRAVAWYSTDGGASFSLADDDQLAGRLALGPPIFGGDGVIAMSSAPGNGAQNLLTSSNGREWRAIELSLTRNGAPIAVTASTPGSIGATASGYVLGINLLTAATAEIDGDGTGEAATLIGPAYEAEAALTGTPVIVRHDASVYAFADTGGGTMPVAVDDIDAAQMMPGQMLFDGPAPEIDDVSVYAPDRLMAVVSSWPHTTAQDGSLTWGPDKAWSVLNEGAWARDDEPQLAESSMIVGNGETSLIVQNSADDPGDDDADLRITGGSQIRYRTDAGWGDPLLILTGPGGDSVNDAAPIGEGFVFVGAHSRFTPDGVTQRRPALAEVVGNEVGQATIDGVSGEQTTLSMVAGQPSGSAIAIATDWSGERGVTFAIERDVDGSWSRSGLDIDDPDLSILDIVDDDGTLAIIGVTDSELLHIPTDGSERTAIEFPRDNIAINAAVALDDRTFVIGRVYTESSSRLAVWEIVDGQLRRIRFDTPVVDLGLSVDGAVAHGGALQIAGARDGYGVVWSISPPAN